MKEESSFLKDSLLWFRYYYPTFRKWTQPGLSLSIGGQIWVKGDKKILPRNTDGFHRSHVYWSTASYPFPLCQSWADVHLRKLSMLPAASLRIQVTKRQASLMGGAFQLQATTTKGFPSSGSTRITKPSIAYCDLKLSIVFSSTLSLLPLFLSPPPMLPTSPTQSANFLSYSIFFPCLPRTVRPTKPEIAEKAEITQRWETGGFHAKTFGLESLTMALT